MKCPQCAALVPEKDLERMMSGPDFEQYDQCRSFGEVDLSADDVCVAISSVSAGPPH